MKPVLNVGVRMEGSSITEEIAVRTVTQIEKRGGAVAIPPIFALLRRAWPLKGVIE